MTGVLRVGVAVGILLLIAVAAVGLATGATGESDNEAPLASAGLDQEVVVNETVLLDASGSRDPDGAIEKYEWAIETPTGRTVTPSCADCVRPEFQVRQVGTYRATVTITDDDGATRSDTARITVSQVDPPMVELSGPTSVIAGNSSEYTATLTAGDNPLARAEWAVDGQFHDRRSVDGKAATDSITLAFTEPGTHTVSVEGYDRFGLSAGATVTVDVSIPHGSRPCPAAVWNETSGTWDTEGCGNAPDAVGSDAAGDGVACSEYSSAGGPRGDRKECDDDRLYWSFERGDPLELYDGNSDGMIEYAGLEGTPEELAARYDGVEATVGDGVRFEGAEAYRAATGGVPPDTNPNAWYNEDPELLTEAAEDKDIVKDKSSAPSSVGSIEALVGMLRNIDPENEDVENQLDKQLEARGNSVSDVDNRENSGNTWWNDPISNTNDGESNNGIVDTVVDTATDLMPGIGGGENEDGDSSEDRQKGGLI